MSRIWDRLWIRMAVMLLIGLLFGWLVSEISFLLTPDTSQRESRRIELVIPAGTADKIKAGQAAPSIPAAMTFVTGDLLVVKNQDNTSHRLGPIWVPPQSSGVLEVSSDSSSRVECSFTQSKVFNLEMQPALTVWIRLQGIISIGLPTGVMLALYTLAAPRKKLGESDED